ncbi:MAG: zinc-binding alcohol dehydrogenase [Armatimonadetes bacterium]|nr:zinc-binding alcohol dehydrogenase [Armatimonadota bacterium]
MKARAVYAVAKDTVELQEFDVDESALEPDKVLVETLYTAISPGTELDCVSGKETSWFHFPQQLGYCCVGKITAAGSKVADFAIGDVVLTPSSHASHHLVGANEIRAKVPTGLDPKIAVWTHMANISITALRAATAELGDTVVVLGQGLIGAFAAQLFRAQGGRVIAVDRIAGRLEIAEECGIEMTVDAAKEDAVEAVKRLTDGRGAEIIVEATGSAAVALGAIGMAGQNAEMILLGTPRGSHEADVAPLLRAVHRASPNLTLKGAHGGSLPPVGDQFKKHSVARNAGIILQMMERGELKVEPLLTATVTPQDAPHAYRQLREQPEKMLGITIDWTT